MNGEQSLALVVFVGVCALSYFPISAFLRWAICQRIDDKEIP